MPSRDGLLRNAHRTGMPLDLELCGRGLIEEVKTKLREAEKAYVQEEVRAISEHQVEGRNGRLLEVVFLAGKQFSNFTREI